MNTTTPNRWLTLCVLALTQLVVVLDGTIVNIALPQAQLELGLTDGQRQWVVTAYALAFGALLLLGGRVADYWGRKRTYLVGMVGFGLASAWGGMASSGLELIIARGLQGAFAALLAPAALALLTVTFTHGRDRNTAFAVFGTIAGAGAAVGLVLGGGIAKSLVGDLGRYQERLEQTIRIAPTLTSAELGDFSGAAGGVVSALHAVYLTLGVEPAALSALPKTDLLTPSSIGRIFNQLIE